MKKFIILLIIVLFSINIDNVKALGYCKYNYNNTNLVVYENGTNSIGYTIDDAKAKVKLEASDFFENDQFKCIDLNVEIKNSQIQYYSPTPFTSVQSILPAIIWPKASGQTNSTCYYEYKKDKKHIFNLMLSIGNNRLNFAKAYETGINDVDYSYIDINDFINNEGVFDCSLSKIDIAFFQSSYIFDTNDVNLCSSSNDCSNTIKIDYQSTGPGGVVVPIPKKPITSGTMNRLNLDKIPNYFFSEGEISCNGILAGDFGDIVRKALNFLKFLVPIIIIGLTMIDFLKAIIAQDNKEINKAGNKLVKRIIIGIIIFLVPTILEFVLDLAGIPFGTCGIK